MRGDDAVQTRTSNLALFGTIAMHSYLLITARITVHDSYNFIPVQLVRELVSRSQVILCRRQ